MRKLTRWAARLYPRAWRNRYGPEFDALLEDIAPSWTDAWDVTGRALRLRGRALLENELPILLEAFPMGRALHLRSSVVVAVIAHTMVLSFIVLASRAYVAPMGWNAPAAPLPPPAPAPPAQITDPRVFHGVSLLYSSLPLRLPSNSSALFTDVVKGVGIFFPPLPDIGTIDRRKNPVRRVWPGQGVEPNITRRVLPKYPAGTQERVAVSVFLEYLIGTDGAVRVLRTSGPTLYANAARSAVERWEYQPVKFDGATIEVISRVEVRFDGELANAEDSTRQ